MFSSLSSTSTSVAAQFLINCCQLKELQVCTFKAFQPCLLRIMMATWTCCEPTPHSHRHCLLSCSPSASSPPLPPQRSHCLDDSETPDCQRGLCSPGIGGTASSCHPPPQKSAPRPHQHWAAATGGQWGGCFLAGRFHGGTLCTRCSQRGGGLPGSRGSTQSPCAQVCSHLGAGWFSVKNSARVKNI